MHHIRTRDHYSSPTRTSINTVCNTSPLPVHRSTSYTFLVTHTVPNLSACAMLIHSTAHHLFFTSPHTHLNSLSAPFLIALTSATRHRVHSISPFPLPPIRNYIFPHSFSPLHAVSAKPSCAYIINHMQLLRNLPINNHNTTFTFIVSHSSFIAYARLQPLLVHSLLQRALLTYPHHSLFSNRHAVARAISSPHLISA